MSPSAADAPRGLMLLFLFLICRFGNPVCFSTQYRFAFATFKEQHPNNFSFYIERAIKKSFNSPSI
jgi:hypothetical protein